MSSDSEDYLVEIGNLKVCGKFIIATKIKKILCFGCKIKYVRVC